MAKEKTLKAALDRHTGVNHKLDHQKKLQKQAEKRKRQKKQDTANEEGLEDAVADGEGDVVTPSLARSKVALQEEESAANGAEAEEKTNGEAEGWETDESEDAEDDDQDLGVELGAFEDESDSDSEDEDLLQNEGDSAADTNGVLAQTDEDDIPLSDIESLASEEKGDVIPHQRLTINNTAALQRSLKSFALPSSLPFSATQSVTTAEPVSIPDVEDDLGRELAFYKQSLDAVKEARSKLKKEGVPFARPADYFAEMVKSEEQMGKVRQKVVDEAARKKASSDARRQRDLKKFGKAVQVAKLQERDKAKRDTLDKINTLKRSKSCIIPLYAYQLIFVTERQGADLNANEDNMFDVALEDAAATEKGDRAARRSKGDRDGAGSKMKRQKKDEKFGFGGKKRYAKSNDARSSGEMKDYSARKMKGGAKAAKQRPGKSRRAKMG